MMSSAGSVVSGEGGKEAAFALVVVLAACDSPPPLVVMERVVRRRRLAFPFSERVPMVGKAGGVAVAVMLSRCCSRGGAVTRR